MEKMIEIKKARKRRSKLLSYFEDRNTTVNKRLTITKFAAMHGVSRSRMGQLLAKARLEVERSKS